VQIAEVWHRGDPFQAVERHHADPELFESVAESKGFQTLVCDVVGAEDSPQNVATEIINVQSSLRPTLQTKKYSTSEKMLFDILFWKN
jgi:hypothetical protein